MKNIILLSLIAVLLIAAAPRTPVADCGLGVFESTPGQYNGWDQQHYCVASLSECPVPQGPHTHPIVIACTVDTGDTLRQMQTEYPATHAPVFVMSLYLPIALH